MPLPPWRSLPAPGDEITNGLETPQHTTFRLTALPDTRLLAPAMVTDGTPPHPDGFLAMFRVDGDPVADMQTYAHELGRTSPFQSSVTGHPALNSYRVGRIRFTFGTDDLVGTDTSIDGTAVTTPNGKWLVVSSS